MGNRQAIIKMKYAKIVLIIVLILSVVYIFSCSNNKRLRI